MYVSMRYCFINLKDHRWHWIVPFSRQYQSQHSLNSLNCVSVPYINTKHKFILLNVRCAWQCTKRLCRLWMLWMWIGRDGKETSRSFEWQFAELASRAHNSSKYYILCSHRHRIESVIQYNVKNSILRYRFFFLLIGFIYIAYIS